MVVFHSCSEPLIIINILLRHSTLVATRPVSLAHIAVLKGHSEQKADVSILFAIISTNSNRTYPASILTEISMFDSHKLCWRGSALLKLGAFPLYLSAGSAAASAHCRQSI